MRIFYFLPFIGSSHLYLRTIKDCSVNCVFALVTWPCPNDRPWLWLRRGNEDNNRDDLALSGRVMSKWMYIMTYFSVCDLCDLKNGDEKLRWRLMAWNYGFVCLLVLFVSLRGEETKKFYFYCLREVLILKCVSL